MISRAFDEVRKAAALDKSINQLRDSWSQAPPISQNVIMLSIDALLKEKVKVQRECVGFIELAAGYMAPYGKKETMMKDMDFWTANGASFIDDE